MAYRFDVAFSFAGPHREKVRAIAELVAAKLGRDKVFFDEWYEHEILGSDMDVLLQRFYYEQSLMVVADLSDEYADRQWCQAEARAIRTLRFEIDPARDETKRLRLLDARFGSGSVPGIFNTTAYLDGIAKTVEQCAELILNRLELLRQRLGAAAPVLNTLPPAVPTTVQEPPICWFHPATNDQLYSRRELELAWLDQCAKNPLIRIATVTGVGGLGKTSLVGHWIEVRQGWQYRAFRGVFFYSFYSDRESAHFFSAFLDFAYKSLGQNRPGKDGELHHNAATLAQRWPFLVVLDGLEVLQADTEDSHYGWINDGELNEFVSRLGEKGSSLLVLTSRFPFPEVTRQIPDRARPLELTMFLPEEGADLLEKCGLPEDRRALKSFSEQFGGHPLALRLFAGASLTAPATDPCALSREVMRAEKSSTLPDPNESGIPDDERQRRRHRRHFQKLLEWLQAKLPAPKRRLLQLVALFREPVPTVTLVALAQDLRAMKADFASCDSARVRSLLDALVREHLLQREDIPGSDTARWAAHPIVREVFRYEALKADETIAKQFADIVVGKGKGQKPKTLTELQPILEAIEVLLAAGNFRAANDLYRGRLGNGYVFQSIPAPQEGLRCARGFVEPKERRRTLELALGRGRLAFFLSATALRGRIVGEMDNVERRYEEVARIQHEEGIWKNVSNQLQNLADSQVLLGALIEAAGSATEALFYAGVEEAEMSLSAEDRHPRRPSRVPSHDARQERHSRTYRANALSLAGELSAASRDFATADSINRKEHPENLAANSLNGIRWCGHRSRLGDTAAAIRLTEANQPICERNGWKDYLALCDLLLGQLDLEAGYQNSAARRIGESVRVFREARMGQYLPDALLAQARLRGNIEDCEEALRLAARSGFALKHCDALNLRARLRREAGQPADAAKDARDALDIAERCVYYWGRHEALRQLREAAKALGNRADEKHWDEAEQALAARMKPEIEEALRINREHDAEMERLYGGPKPQK